MFYRNMQRYYVLSKYAKILYFIEICKFTYRFPFIDIQVFTNESIKIQNFSNNTILFVLSLQSGIFQALSYG